MMSSLSILTVINLTHSLILIKKNGRITFAFGGKPFANYISCRWNYNTSYRDFQ